MNDNEIQWCVFLWRTSYRIKYVETFDAYFSYQEAGLHRWKMLVALKTEFLVLVVLACWQSWEQGSLCFCPGNTVPSAITTPPPATLGTGFTVLPVLLTGSPEEKVPYARPPLLAVLGTGFPVLLSTIASCPRNRVSYASVLHC